MLKVAVVTAHFPSPEKPTHGRSAYDTLVALSKKANVEVFFPRVVYPGKLKARNAFVERVGGSVAMGELKAHYVNFPALPVLSRPFNGWTIAHALLPAVRRFSPDVLLSYFLYPEAYAAVLMGRKLNVPVVSKAVGSDVHSIHGLYTRILTKRVLRDSSRILTVSSDLRDRSIALGADPGRVQAHLNGCDSEKFLPLDRQAARNQIAADAGGQIVVYIGRLDNRKGLLELVDAVSLLKSSRPGLHCYLVGDGPDRAEILSRIRGHHAEAFIHLTGACAPEAIPVWMAASDLVTLPSYAEGCPNVVLEALASGRPVVATHVGGIPELMDSTCGRLVPPREMKPLAQGIAEVLDTQWDPAMLAAQRGRSWQTVAEELLDVLDGARREHCSSHPVRPNPARRQAEGRVFLD